MKQSILLIFLLSWLISVDAQNFTYFKNDEKAVAFLKEKEAAFQKTMESQKEYLIALTFKTDYLLNKTDYYLFRTIEFFDFGGKTGSSTKIFYYVLDKDARVIDELNFEDGQSEYGGCYTEMELQHDTVFITEYCEQIGYSYDESNEEAEPILVRSGETKHTRAFVLETSGKFKEVMPFGKTFTETIIKDIRQKFAVVNQEFKQYPMQEIMGYSSKYGECVANVYSGTNYTCIETSVEASSQRLIQYFFLEGDDLFFYYDVLLKYNAPISTEYYDETKTTKEVKRYYFYDQQLIRWLDKDLKEVPFDNLMYKAEIMRITEDLTEIRNAANY